MSRQGRGARKLKEYGGFALSLSVSTSGLLRQEDVVFLVVKGEANISSISVENPMKTCQNVDLWPRDYLGSIKF